MMNDKAVARGARQEHDREPAQDSGARARTTPAAPLARDAFLSLAGHTRNRNARAIERLSADVASRVGLLHSENRARFTAFNSIVEYVYPEASVERGLACSLWCNWLFFFDDVHDEDFAATDDLDEVRTRMAHYLYLLAGAPPEGALDPLERLTLEVRAHTLALGGEAWMLRFCRTVSDYLFLGSLPAVQNWRCSYVPTLEEYTFQREHDTAVLTTLDLIEIANGITLPADALKSRELSAARSACARTIGFFNDIVSYPKEVLRHRNPNNLVHVLMHHEGLDLHEALLLATDLTNQAAQEQLRLSNRLVSRLPPGPHPVREYLYAMRVWQRGNIDFSLEGARYAARWSPLAELTARAPRARREAA